MPATEQTWRDTKRLHQIFAITSILMLGSTIWMFVKDHNREWKPYQLTALDAELKLTDWRRLQYLTDEAITEHKELLASLQDANRQAIDANLIQEFIAELGSGYSGSALTARTSELQAAAGTEAAEAIRQRILADLGSEIRNARTREDKLLGDLKFARADRDAAVATLGLLVRDAHTMTPERAQQAQANQQQEVDLVMADVAEKTDQYEVANTHRLALEKIVDQITTDVDQCADAVAKNQTALEQLKTATEERRSNYVEWYGIVPLPGKKWLELPILDAFNSPRKIDNLWHEGLEHEYGSYGNVRRFDRCTTCHQSIQKTLPGSATEPAYAQDNFIDFLLEPPTPEALQAASDTVDSDLDLSPDEREMKRLQLAYGLRLADEGLIASNDVTVQFVQPESVASRARPAEGSGEPAKVDGVEVRQSLLKTSHDGAGFVGIGLAVGDVIALVGDDKIDDPRALLFRLLDAAESQETLSITIKRGLGHPYSSHPRLDLFVGSLSPHKMSDFACTVCHEGQGSATAFKWASHSPNSERQRKDWRQEHGWFDNHHWIFPMHAKRFAEASCLKCHHEVTELEPSERFPDPPAPKVVKGYHLVRKYGCFGCHEVNGYDAGERIGPDLRLEPNYFAAALQLRAEPGFAKLTAEQQGWINQLIDHPEREGVRKRIYQLLVEDEQSNDPLFSKTVHSKIAPLLKGVDSPGKLRKVGPSLRFSAHKNTEAFLFDWIRNPKHFRPSTRMPQFFGLWDHLDDQGKGDVAEKYEPLEVLGVTSYLLERTQDFDYLTPPEGTEPADAARGKVLFENKGCLACHSHGDFPDTSAYRGKDEIVQGPDLTGLGDKFAGENGRKWLYSWIKEPTRYHARTVMPNLFLDPIESADGAKTDPAADIAEYLLSSKRGWHAADGTLSASGLSEQQQATLKELVLENLRDAFAGAAAKRYVETGIPAEFRDELKGAEVELVVDGDGTVDADGKLTTEAQLLYVGRKTIAKYGCYACHDVPGFEDAKPIGTALADWGRKEPAKLAFEHILEYFDHHGGEHGHEEGHDHGDGHAEDDGHADDGHAEHDPLDDFYKHKIASHHREGFIYQKLREPRSYDYHKTGNKKYNERLRMPNFPFDADAREAVITFVVGLVADPPSERYIYNPSPRQEAIVAGRQVLQKYNCGGCHVLDGQQWEVSYESGQYAATDMSSAYPFIHSHVTPDVLSASSEKDASGLLHATLSGMPTLDDFGTPLATDDFGDPLEDGEQYDPSKLEYLFDLWDTATVEGNVLEVGGLPLPVRSSQIEKRRDTDGGFLAKYLLTRVIAQEKQVNPAAKGTEAWGWLPPPLIGQGNKVQSDWLHEFLLNPYPIRPAVVLRMPKFNMSPDEASRLVNYFAAVDNANYPYAFNPRQQLAHLDSAESAYQGALQANGGDPSTRLDDAMKIVTNNNYCVKCHLVGDFEPQGADRAKAPNLAEVYRRLRPDYLRKWIANPKAILPYTSMPVNVPYKPDATDFRPAPDQPVLYHGTSVETVDALVDLLMNYDVYAKRRSPVTPLVSGAAPADATTSVVPAPVTTPRPTPPPKPTPPKPTPPPADAGVPAALMDLPEATGWGDLKVQFVYDGDPPNPAKVEVNKDPQFCGPFNLVDETVVVNKENGGLANVFAYLYLGRDAKKIPIHESYHERAREQVVIDNAKCRFEPRAVAIWTPQTVVLKNSDAVGHNTNYATFSNPPDNILIPAGGQIERKLSADERLPSKVACNIHPWMTSYMLIKNNPYVGISDKDGNISIKNLPEGEWTLQVWHERSGYVADVKVDGQATEWRRGRVDIKVVDGETVDLGVIRFAPDRKE